MIVASLAVAACGGDDDSASTAATTDAPTSATETGATETGATETSATETSATETRATEQTATAGTTTTTADSAVSLPEVPAGTTLSFVDSVGQLVKPQFDWSGAGEGARYEIEWQTAPSNVEMIQQVVSGVSDVAWVNEGSTITAFANDVDVRQVGVTKTPGSAVFLVAHPNAGLTSVEELAGKKVAVTRGTPLELFLAAALEEAGLSIDDVEVVNVPPTETLAALASEQVDAATLPGPFYTNYRAQAPGSVLLRDGRGLGTGQGYLIVAPDLLEDPARSAALADFVVRIARAFQWVEDNPEEYIEGFYVGISNGNAEDGRFLQSLGVPLFVPITDEVVTAQQDYADFAFRLGVLSREIEVAPRFDDRFNPYLELQ